MKKIIIAVLTGFGIIAATGSCHKCTNMVAVPDPCLGVRDSFATAIKPLFTTSCSYSPACHRTGSSNTGGVLMTYDQIFAKIVTIKLVVTTGTMPPPPQTLTSDQKKQINCWIANGALNN